MDPDHYDSFTELTSTVPTPPVVTIGPPISPEVHLSLTIVFIALYGSLFLAVYLQLWMILYHKHRRLSYQSVFLFLCLVWSGLRTTLFSFYFENCVLANTLSTFPYWLLYSFPVCLQFITLCLLVLFFSQVVFKSRAKYEPNKYRTPLHVGLAICVAIFMTTNVTCAILIKEAEDHSHTNTVAIMVRVVINETLFLFCGFGLAYFIYRMSKMSAANMVLEAKGTTKCQALSACIVIIVLYASRSVYNFFSISQAQQAIPSFGFGWVNVSDQADFLDEDHSFSYVSYGIVLFVWEFLPTFIVILIFRVKAPDSPGTQPLGRVSNKHYANTHRAYFFDNPRRYDSDEDVSVSRSYTSRSGSVLDGTGAYTISPGTSAPILGSYGHSYHGYHPSHPAAQSTSLPHPPMPSTEPVFYNGT